MRKVKVHYPWETLPPKGTFFVPSLNLKETREAGLKAAVYHKVKAKAHFVHGFGELTFINNYKNLYIKAAAN
jgi:hypothetical protein